MHVTSQLPQSYTLHSGITTLNNGIMVRSSIDPQNNIYIYRSFGIGCDVGVTPLLLEVFGDRHIDQLGPAASAKQARKKKARTQPIIVCNA